MNVSTDLLMPLMVLGFLGAVSMRVLIYITIKKEQWFAKAFEKRTHDYLLKMKKRDMKLKYTSFYVTTKMLLEKTYYELFMMRAILKRRNPDIITDKWDRVFLLQQGCARLVKDTLKHVQFFKYDKEKPDLEDAAKTVFEKNPQFNAVFGYFPVGTFNETLNLLPGIFIVCGIFGTFLGIMAALPELGAMDLADVDKTKQVMDTFLVKMSYSMITSILGILLNITMTFLNAFMNPNKIFVDIVERYAHSLEKLWSICSNNALPSEIKDFDEHKDPIEALAEESVEKEHQKSKYYIEEQADKENEKLEEIVKYNSKKDEAA
jgi:hypothetical protein